MFSINVCLTQLCAKMFGEGVWERGPGRKGQHWSLKPKSTYRQPHRRNLCTINGVFLTAQIISMALTQIWFYKFFLKMPITWSNFRFHFKIIVSFLSRRFTIWCIKVCCKDTKNPFFLVMFLQISGRRWNCLSVSSACCNLEKATTSKWFSVFLISSQQVTICPDFHRQRRHFKYTTVPILTASFSCFLPIIIFHIFLSLSPVKYIPNLQRLHGLLFRIFWWSKWNKSNFNFFEAVDLRSSKQIFKLFLNFFLLSEMTSNNMME